MKIKKPAFTKTTIRIAMWNALVIFLLYLLFNVFSIIILEFQLEKTLDSTIEHEIEHILHTFRIESDSLIIVNSSEYNESDLVEVTDSPFFLQIFKPNGYMVLHSKNIHKFPRIPKIIPEMNEDIIFSDLDVSNIALRVGYTIIKNPEGGIFGYMQLSTLKSSTQGIENEIILFNLLSFPVFLIIIVTISFYLAKKSYAPINKIIDIAKTIGATNLHQRLEFKEDQNDELGRLQSTLNTLFERLQKQVEKISNFTDNASHQLMTPLTILNTEIDFMLKHRNPDIEIKDSLIVLREQTGRLIHIVKTLLLISKDHNDDKMNRSVFNLSTVVQKEIKSHNSLDRIKFHVTDNIFVKGDKDNFLLVLNNLIDNALKYSLNQDEIYIEVVIADQKVKITVEDMGIGISDLDKKRVFERFYRSKKSVNSLTSGYGLGLSLVEAIVTSMQGKVDIEDNIPQGTKFIISLQALKIS